MGTRFEAEYREPTTLGPCLENGALQFEFLHKVPYTKRSSVDSSNKALNSQILNLGGLGLRLA